MSGPISGSTGDSRAIAAKRLKKSSSVPKTIEGRRITAAGKAARTAGLALGLGAGVGAGAVGVGADGGDVDERPTPSSAAMRAMRPAPSAMHRLEALLAALGQDADAVDHRVGAGDGAAGRGVVADVGLDRLDLADDAVGPHECASFGRRTATRTRQPARAMRWVT